MSSKEKEVILKLLELYKEMPFLWDKKHKDYKNKDCRNEGNRVLLEIFKNIEPNATIKTLNKKLQNLRTNYMKELKKVKDSSRTGAGADDRYTPNLYYYDAMTFLGAYSETCRTTRDTLGIEDISSDDETQSETQSMSSDMPKRKKKRPTQDSLLEKQNKLMATAEEFLNFKEKDEDWEVMGKSIGLQLRDLDKSKLRIVQKIISDAIYYASTGALTHNSFIALGPPVISNFPYASPSTSSSYGHQESHSYQRSHQMQTPQPPPSPYHQVQSPEAPPSPYNQIQIQRSQPPPSPYHQVQSPEAPPSPYNQIQIQRSQPPPSPYHQVQSPEAPPSPYNQIQIQRSQPPPSPYHQVQSPEAPPSPYNQIQIQRSQPPPSPYHQVQSPEAPPSPYNQMQTQTPQPPPSSYRKNYQPAPPSHHTQPFEETPSNLQNSSISLGEFEFNTENFPNTSVSSSDNIVVECKGSEIKDFLIFKPKKK